jgi:TIR domain
MREAREIGGTLTGRGERCASESEVHSCQERLLSRPSPRGGGGLGLGGGQEGGDHGQRAPAPSLYSPPMQDFFISYNRADRAWAEWIARELQAAGFSVVSQFADFGPDSNFVVEMDRATQEAQRLLAVLSPSGG